MATKLRESLHAFLRGFLACLFLTPILGGLCLCCSGSPRSDGFYALGGGIGSLLQTSTLIVGLVFINSNTDYLCDQIAIFVSKVSPTPDPNNNQVFNVQPTANVAAIVDANCHRVIKDNFAYPCLFASGLGLIALGLIMTGVSQVHRLHKMEKSEERAQLDKKEGKGFKKPLAAVTKSSILNQDCERTGSIRVDPPSYSILPK
ncbi:hypothetical protein BC830DRAFT_1218115 [Chytriomyces sp. MP71]|nr:hypothetical protein BC830DRAFT_1218115 [Chytriomyces sp. MP71]